MKIKKKLNNVYTIIPVIASLECYNKIPHIWWIKERKIVGSQFWRSFRHLVSTVTRSCLIFVTPRTSARQASLSITSSESLLKLMSIESVWPSDHVILCSPSPPTFNHSQHQGLFKWVSSSHQVAKEVLEFQLQHQSLHWIFRTDFI